jgi:hypothetical protein
MSEWTERAGFHDFSECDAIFFISSNITGINSPKRKKGEVPLLSAQIYI